MLGLVAWCARAHNSTTIETAADDEAMKMMWASVESMIRVGVIGSVGGLLAWQGTLNISGRKSLARILGFGLLPMLLFTKVSRAMSNARTDLLRWLVLPLYVAAHVGFGLLLGRLLALAWKKKRRNGKFSALPQSEEQVVDDTSCADVRSLVSLVVAFPNSGALPLALLDSLCSSLGDDWSGDKECLASTIGYVSFYISFLNPLQWLICPLYLARRRDAETPPVDSTRSIVLKKLANIPPPVYAALFGAIFGAVPPAYRFVREGTVLGGAFEAIGDAAVPVGIINLGAAVYASFGVAGGADSSSSAGVVEDVPKFVLAAAGLLRLVVVPAVSIALTSSIRGNFVLVPESNKPLALVLMLESCPPPAMQLIIFTQLYDLANLERPLAQLLVLTYLAGLVTVTAWISLILNILR